MLSPRQSEEEELSAQFLLSRYSQRRNYIFLHQPSPSLLRPGLDNLTLEIFNSDLRPAADTGDQSGGLQSAERPGSELVTWPAGGKGGGQTCLLHHQTDTKSIQEAGAADEKTTDTQEDAD